MRQFIDRGIIAPADLDLSYAQGGNKLVEELSFGGFGLGANFRF